VQPRLPAINSDFFGAIFCLVSETTDHNKVCKYRNKLIEEKFHVIIFWDNEQGQGFSPSIHDLSTISKEIFIAGNLT